MLPGPGYVELAVTAWGPQVWPCWTAWWLLVPKWDEIFYTILGLVCVFWGTSQCSMASVKELRDFVTESPRSHVFCEIWEAAGAMGIGRISAPRFFTLVINTRDLVIRCLCPRVACWNPRKWNLKESESWWWFTTFLDRLPIQGWIELLTFPGSGSYKKWKPQRVWTWGISIPIACNFRTSCRW